MNTVSCPNCGRILSLPANADGKRVRCKACEEIFDPAKALAVGAESPAPASATRPSNDQWFAKADSGQEYGPVSRGELDQWVAQGRVNGRFQLLPPGTGQWQWAETVFPQLAHNGHASPGGYPAPALIVPAHAGAAAMHYPQAAYPSYPGAGWVCPYCRASGYPFYREEISTGGWVLFAVLLVFFWPLCFLGLLIKDRKCVCRNCGRAS